MQAQGAVGIGKACTCNCHRVGGAIDRRNARDLTLCCQISGERKVVHIQTTNAFTEDELERYDIVIGDILVSHRRSSNGYFGGRAVAQHRKQRRTQRLGRDLNLKPHSCDGQHTVFSAIGHVENEAVVWRVGPLCRACVGVAVLELAVVDVGLREGAVHDHRHLGAVDRAIAIGVEPELTVAGQGGHGVGEPGAVVISVQLFQVVFGDGACLALCQAEELSLLRRGLIQIATAVHGVDAA